MKTIKWTVSDQADSKYIGAIEFQDNKGEFHDFEVIRTHSKSKTPHRVVFGGCCNAGFIESGYLEYEQGFESVDDALSEMLADLQVYYDDGPNYVSRIVCNERM